MGPRSFFFFPQLNGFIIIFIKPGKPFLFSDLKFIPCICPKEYRHMNKCVVCVCSSSYVWRAPQPKLVCKMAGVWRKWTSLLLLPGKVTSVKDWTDIRRLVLLPVTCYAQAAPHNPYHYKKIWCELLDIYTMLLRIRIFQVSNEVQSSAAPDLNSKRTGVEIFEVSCERENDFKVERGANCHGSALNFWDVMMGPPSWPYYRVSRACCV